MIDGIVSQMSVQIRQMSVIRMRKKYILNKDKGVKAWRLDRFAMMAMIF